MIYLKEFAWASASRKVFFSQHTHTHTHTHIHTTHTYPPTPPHTPYTQPLHRHASTERCFHHTEQRRAKRQLGQRGHNLLGNSAAKLRITFGGSLDWKWLSKFISLFCKKKKKKKPVSRWRVHEKLFKVLLLQIFLLSAQSNTGFNSKVKLRWYHLWKCISLV